MRIAIVSDAWRPQVNGVVRALVATVDQLRAMGHEVMTVTPSHFRTFPCPRYPEIRLALWPRRSVRRMLGRFAPDAVHIATEGPLGWAARGWCKSQARPFTSSFHTRFPDYVALRTGLPAGMFWPIMRHFHNAAERTFAVTDTLAVELRARGFDNVHRWPLGTDLAAFSPDIASYPAMRGLDWPIQLSVGRVAVEKNLTAFLDTRVPGSKVVVGDGPALEELRAAYPSVIFLGALHGAELAAAYVAADVFVFPSRTDTFGLVNIEALASGLPVAAYPVAGPLDILGAAACGVNGGTRPIGALDEDLSAAIERALLAERLACRAEAAHYNWASCTDAFLAGLAAAKPPVSARIRVISSLPALLAKMTEAATPNLRLSVRPNSSLSSLRHQRTIAGPESPS